MNVILVGWYGWGASYDNIHRGNESSTGPSTEHFGAVSKSNVRELVEESAAQVFALAEHYYQERLPAVEVIDGTERGTYVRQWPQLGYIGRAGQGRDDGEGEGELSSLVLKGMGGSYRVLHSCKRGRTNISMCFDTRSLSSFLLGGPPVQLTCVEAHLHYSLFEVLKNALRATIDKSVRLNANTIPSVKVRILDAPEEVCIYVQDKVT